MRVVLIGSGKPAFRTKALTARFRFCGSFLGRVLPGRILLRMRPNMSRSLPSLTASAASNVTIVEWTMLANATTSGRAIRTGSPHCTGGNRKGR